MYIRLKIRDEIYRLLEKYCKKNNLNVNKFVEKIIIEKIEIEKIKEEIKDITQKFLFEKETTLDDELEDIVISYMDDENKIKH